MAGCLILLAWKSKFSWINLEDHLLAPNWSIYVRDALNFISSCYSSCLHYNSNLSKPLFPSVVVMMMMLHHYQRNLLISTHWIIMMMQRSWPTWTESTVSWTAAAKTWHWKMRYSIYSLLIFFWFGCAHWRDVCPCSCPHVNEFMLSSLLRWAVPAAVPQKQMMKKQMGRAVVNHQGLKRRKCL